MLRLGLSLGVPALILLVAVPLRRAHQIPAVDPGCSVAEFTRPLTAAEQQTLALYNQAWKKFWENAPAYETALTQERAKLQRPGDTASKRDVPVEGMEELGVHHFQPTLQLLETAHQRPAVPLGLMSCDLHNAGGEDAVQFIWLLESQAGQRERAGDLDDAQRFYRMALEVVWRTRLRARFAFLLEADRLEHSVLWDIVNRWAVHPQQTRQRAVTALRELAAYQERGTGYGSAVKDKHVRWERFLNGDLSAASQLGLTGEEARSFRMLLTAIPWERSRCRRLLCCATSYDLDQLYLSGETSQDSGRNPLLQDSQAIAHWSRSTLLGRNWGLGEYTFYPGRRVLERHAALVRIALADWRREHGSLPESLDALVGTYFEKLPPHPTTRRPFVYFPQGLPYDLTESRPDNERIVLLAKGTPFLWTSWGESTLLSRFMGRMEARTEENDTLTRGERFPIPPPSD